MRKLALLWLMVPALALAQAQDVPLKLGFQGRLVASDGTALGGVKNVTFSIYTGPTDSTPIWTETQKLALTNGFYTTFLGVTTPLSASSLATGSDLFVGVTVDGTELTPRQQIGSVVYAFRAAHAVEADHAARASNADQATNATSAVSAQNATNANHADQATNAANANNAGYAGSAGTATNVSGGTVQASNLTATNAIISNLNAPGLVIGSATMFNDEWGSCQCDVWGEARCDCNWGVSCNAGRRLSVGSGVLCVR
jgi:hypothetical protein